MATLEELENRLDNLSDIVATIAHVDSEELKKITKGEAIKGKANNIRKHI
jgi:predicted transcriptional regulator